MPRSAPPPVAQHSPRSLATSSTCRPQPHSPPLARPPPSPRPRWQSRPRQGRLTSKARPELSVSPKVVAAKSTVRPPVSGQTAPAAAQSPPREAPSRGRPHLLPGPRLNKPTPGAHPPGHALLQPQRAPVASPFLAMCLSSFSHSPVLRPHSLHPRRRFQPLRHAADEPHQVANSDRLRPIAQREPFRAGVHNEDP